MYFPKNIIDLIQMSHKTSALWATKTLTVVYVFMYVIAITIKIT